MTGRTISHYQILEKLGEGGMGVVYKARDTHLDRFVAIKVLPPERVPDPSRKARFVQEAKAASALNHPNIVHIYDISTDAGQDLIAMEYVAGKTLDQLIPRKGMRLSEALKIAVQIADALARAHAAGIIHRDLKPANVMVDEHGTVKVLDFGLAKLTEQQTSNEATTATIGVKTGEGIIVGTAAYMSPEQAEGKPLDARSDIFSFGAVLYEMVTGQRAFQGDSKLSTLSAVLREEPKPIKDLPRDLEKLIARCLRKASERRMQHMDDVRLALEDLKEESESGPLAAVSPPRPRRRLRQLAAGVVAVAGTAAGWWIWSHSGAAVQPRALRETPLTADPGFESYPSFSPDGMTVAFTRTPLSDRAPIGSSIAVKMIGAEDTSVLVESAMSPVWSPDGRWLAFTPTLSPAQAATGHLMLIPRIGGTARKVNDLGVRNWQQRLVAWTSDGKWMLAAEFVAASRKQPLVLISAETGERKNLSWGGAPLLGGEPALAPGGKWLAFVRAGALGSTELLVVPLDAGYQPAAEPRRLPVQVPEPNCPVWTNDGKEIVFCSRTWHAATLWRIQADGSGEAEPLAIGGRGAFQPDISRTGHRLVYNKHSWNTDIWQVKLDASGRAAGTPRPFLPSTAIDYSASWSPNGKLIAFVSERSGTAEIWIANADGSALRKLTGMDSRWGMEPQWSPDGEWLVFCPETGGNRDIYIVPVGGGPPRRLTHDSAVDLSPEWSRDGQWILFRSDRGGSFGTWRVPVKGGEVQRAGTEHLGEADPGDGWRYVMKSSGSRYSIWRRPATGGEEQRIVDSGRVTAPYLTARIGAISRKGVYYSTIREPEQTGQESTALLMFHQLATGKDIPILTLKPGTFTGTGLALSPDGRSLLYTQCEEAKSDLMLVENFR